MFQCGMRGPVRIIGGLYRGRKLGTVPGLDVRPTSDRLRETLFNILAPVIEDARFLDLCAGSGAVGIEALSRGAGRATFVEQSKKACAAIRKNLDQLGITEGAHVLNRDAASAIRYLDERGERFDVIYFDPPYASHLHGEVLNLISAIGLLPKEGVVIVEHGAKKSPELEYTGLQGFRRVKQGESQLAFYRRE